MCGPTGIGFLYGKRALLEAMPPFLTGGDMIRQVAYDATTFNELPWKFEAGTSNVADAIALGAAVDYLEGVGMDWVRAHERALTGYALERLRALEPRGLARLRSARRGARRRHLVQPRRHPRARSRVDPRHRRRLRPGRTPLHDAAHARRWAGPQPPARRSTSTIPSATSTPWSKGSKRRPRIFEPSPDAWTISTKSTSSTTTATRATSGTSNAPDAVAEDLNPLCGDQIRIELKVRRRQGRGRALLRQGLRDQPGRDVDADARRCAASRSRTSRASRPRRSLENVGIGISPARMKCATLGLKVAQERRARRDRRAGPNAATRRSSRESRS